MSKLSQFFGGGIGPVGTLTPLPLELGDEFWFDNKNFLRRGSFPYKDYHAKLKEVMPQLVYYGETWTPNFDLGVPGFSQNIGGIRYWWGPNTNKWNLEGAGYTTPARQLPLNWLFTRSDTCASFGGSLYILANKGVLQSYNNDSLLPHSAPPGFNPKYIYTVGDSLVSIGDSARWSVRASEVGDQSRWQHIPIQGGFPTASAAPIPNKAFTLAVKEDSTVWIMHQSVVPQQIPGVVGRKLLYDGQRTILCGENQVWVWSNDTADPRNPAGYWYAPGFSWQSGDASIVDGKLVVMSGVNDQRKRFIYSENYGQAWQFLQVDTSSWTAPLTSITSVVMQRDDLIFGQTSQANRYLVIRTKHPRSIKLQSLPEPWALRLY